MSRVGKNQSVAQSLVVAFRLVMGYEVLNCCPQGGFAEQDHPFQTGFLDAADKSFSVGVQIRRSRWQLDGLDTNILRGAEKPVREQRVPIMDQVALPREQPVD